MARHLRQCTFSCLVFLLAGCGATPKLGKVEGTVKLDGKPVSNATVTFQPTGELSSMGQTDENGHYVLTYGGKLGAVVGDHRVSIETFSVRVGEDDAVVKEPERFPEKYNIDSELTREVKPGKQTINFDLKS